MFRFLLALLLAGCNASPSLPHKVQPTDTYVHPGGDPTSTNHCTVANDCPAGMFCNQVLGGKCVECLNEDHCNLGFYCNSQGQCVQGEQGDPVQPGDSFQPSDPGVNPGDPGWNPGDPNGGGVDTCTYGICTSDSDYYLCEESDGTIPLENPYCDYYTYEGCPDYMTPFIVTYSDGWEDCICIEECTP